MHPRPFEQTVWVPLNITCPQRENEPSQLVWGRLNAGCSLVCAIGMVIDTVPSREEQYGEHLAQFIIYLPTTIWNEGGVPLREVLLVQVQESSCVKRPKAARMKT